MQPRAAPKPASAPQPSQGRAASKVDAAPPLDGPSWTGGQEEEVAEEAAGPAGLPRRTGLLVGRRRIRLGLRLGLGFGLGLGLGLALTLTLTRCRKVAGGEDAKDEDAQDEDADDEERTPRSVSRWAQPLPVLATSAASREREAAERAIDSKWVSSWQLLVEDSAGERLA